MNAACLQAYDRVMRLLRLTLVALTVTSMLCGSALAKNYAPPGRAGTSQYAEDIPAAGGNVSTPAMGGGNKTAAQIDHIGAGRQGVHRLAKLGRTGAQAAQFAQATAPPAPSSTHGLTSGPQTTVTAENKGVLTASGGSALGGVGHLLGGSDAGGIGVFLPLLLALTLAASILAAALRLRRASDGAARL